MRTAFFDIDYTLYNGYLGTDFNMFMVREGYVGNDIARSEAQLLRDFKTGNIDYREASRRALQLHADCLNGRPVKEVEKIQQEFIKDQSKLFPWVRDVMRYLQSQNFNIYLISAAPVTAIKAIADTLGVKKYYGTEFIVRDGQYTGELGTLLNYEEKHQLIKKLITKSSDDIHIGFGDSLGDVDMLGAMDKAILYEPKSEELITIAREKVWTIATKDTIQTIVHDL